MKRINAMIEEIALNSICNTPFVPSPAGRSNVPSLRALRFIYVVYNITKQSSMTRTAKKANAFSTIIAKTLRDCHGAFLQDSQRVLPDMFFCGVIGVYINIA